VAAVARSGLEGAGVALRSRAQVAADACKKGGFMGFGGEQVSAGEQRCWSRCAPRSGLPEPSTQHLGPGAAAPRQIPHAEPAAFCRGSCAIARTVPDHAAAVVDRAEQAIRTDLDPQRDLAATLEQTVLQGRPKVAVRRHLALKD
jgi:hypothetical protein